MASTRKSRPTRPAERPDTNPRPTVSPETQRGILIVLLFALGFLAILSLADLAGAVGRGYELALLRLFGWGRFLIPVILLGIGFVLLQPHRLPFRAMNGLGLFLFAVSLSGLLQLFIPLDKSEAAITAGNGGGYIGFGIALPLLRLMGFWASLLILLALFVISILIFFNTSLTELARRGGTLGSLGSAVRRIPSLRSRDHSEPSFDRTPVREESPTAEDVPLTDVPTSPSASSKPRHQLSLLPKKKSRPTRLSLDLLSPERTVPSSGDIRDRQERIRRTLHNFGIEVEMREVQVGPTVTQFALTPAEGVKLSQITTLGNDLALALAAHPIRIEAPIPGRSAVGIEVPNESVAIVTIREVLESEPFRHARSPLTVALGKDVSGQTVTTDLGILPHLLIAGATGSGKSVMINALIMSLLYQNSPGDLRFIMVDPKRVELTVYNDIPHLLTPVITDSRKTVNALKWIVAEMDRRYQVLSDEGKRDIGTYHRDVDDGMPFIVVIIDELADLMSVAAREVEGAVTRLAQMARAVGIHLVVATQRPSVDVITGLIKANITSRIAFNVASNADSRTILDSSGAEKLLGRGDMLYISAELSKPRRIQGAFVSDDEIRRIVATLKQQATPEYDTTVTEVQGSVTIGDGDESMEEDEQLIGQAKDVIVQAGKASASLLQRRLKIGYARAARMLDILEERGVVGPGEGAKPREIFIAQEPPSAPAPDEPPPPPLDDDDETT